MTLFSTHFILLTYKMIRVNSLLTLYPAYNTCTLYIICLKHKPVRKYTILNLVLCDILLTVSLYLP